MIIIHRRSAEHRFKTINIGIPLCPMNLVQLDNRKHTIVDFYCIA